MADDIRARPSETIRVLVIPDISVLSAAPLAREQEELPRATGGVWFKGWCRFPFAGS
ncbi:hypothetical protein D3C86_1977250 [compost metagenome]